MFNPEGGLGIGSYVQDAVLPGEWVHIVAVVAGDQVRLFKNGAFRRCDQLQGPSARGCAGHPTEGPIVPAHGSAPLRIGARDHRSYFQGGIADVQIWNRALDAAAIADLYRDGLAPRDGLVAEYRLDEGGGDVAHDTAGGHDGALVGTVWEQ